MAVLLLQKLFLESQIFRIVSLADTIDLGTAIGAGSVNDSAAAFVDISNRVLNGLLGLALNTISF